MALVAHNITANRKTGEEITVTVPIYSSEPGVVTASASGCTFPDGETVTIAGTRTWGNMGSGGMYLSRAGSEGNGRSNVTFFLKFDTSKTLPMTKGSAIGAYTWVPLMASVNMTPYNRINWSIALRCYSDVIIVYYVQSASSAAAEVGYAFTSLPLSGENKIALVLDAGDAGNQNVILYRNERASAQTVTRAVTTGTMGGSEALIWHSGMHCSKISRKASDAELDAWFSSETIPASNREFMFSGGHEIDESAPVIWDTSGIATPLDLDDTLTVTRWHAPSMRGDHTDSVPVVPASSIRVTIPAAVSSPVTLSLSRPRAGVPSRASDGERYETASGTITLVNTATIIEAGPTQHVRSRTP